jgi:hypothetical protein
MKMKTITLKTKSLGYNDKLGKEIFETSSFCLKDIKSISENILVNKYSEVFSILNTLEEVFELLKQHLHSFKEFKINTLDDKIIGFEIKHSNEKNTHLSLMITKENLEKMDNIKNNLKINRSNVINMILEKY